MVPSRLDPTRDFCGAVTPITHPGIDQTSRRSADRHNPARFNRVRRVCIMAQVTCYWSASNSNLFRQMLIQELRDLGEILFGLWCRRVSLVLRMRLAFEDL